MLKQSARILTVTVFLLDLGLVALGFVGAYWLRSELLPLAAPALFPSPLYPLSRYLPLLPLTLLIWGALFLRNRLYRSHRTVPLYQECWEVLKISLSGAVIFALAIYVFRLDSLLLPDDLISRFWILLFAAVSCLLLVGEKVAIRLTSRRVRLKGFNYRTVLIVGTGTAAAEVVDSIENHRWWGFRVLGFIASETPLPEPLASRYSVLGGIEVLPRIVESRPVDDVIFAVSRRELERMEDLIASLHEQGIRTRFALNFVAQPKARVELEDLDGIPILTISTGPTNQLHLLGKRLVDISVASTLLLASLPLQLLIVLAIKLSSGGPVLFRQTRCGLNGRLFTLMKYRSMVEDAEERRRELLHLNEMSGPVFKLRQDPRVTSLGRFLRRFSLDELPQLWNVLRGDMSLVGPRPPIPEEVAQYQRWQRRRLSMKPGLTCLWQISGRNDVDFDRWMELDLEYIDT
ncbi:MAG TPA: sugar transferase, partial [Thermoanaerobaculia bacterium]|nr:sugar transferase [Thermoanaerobaculia bacterium]